MSEYTVILQSIKVLGTIFKRQNHKKCKWNSYFGWILLVKIAPTTRIWVQKTKKTYYWISQCIWIIAYSSYLCPSCQALIVYYKVTNKVLFVLFLQGPQGVANFSLCSYYNVSNNAVASDSFPSFSPWAPTETDLEVNCACWLNNTRWKRSQRLILWILKSCIKFHYLWTLYILCPLLVNF